MHEPDADRDPLDELLHAAFAADRARTPTPRVAERVMARIRRRQRLRAALLAGAVVVGAGIAAWSVGPVLTALLEALRSGLTTDWTDRGLALAALALGIMAWLVLAEEESAY